MQRKSALLSSVALASVAVSASAFAAEPAFRLSITAARAGMNTTTTKPDGGKEAKVKTTSLMTFPSVPSALSNLELAIFPEGYAVYLYPAATGGSLWLGQAFGDAMELGVTLGLNNSKVDEPKNETMANSIGVYYWGSMPAGPGALEVNVNPNLTIMSGTEMTSAGEGAAAAAPAVEVKKSGTMFGAYADALYVMPWGKNFDYAAGLDLTFTTGDSKAKPKGGTESKTKTTVMDMGIVLAKFRAKF
jgi:hypothetical protein